jgi:hypothetical protein
MSDWCLTPSEQVFRYIMARIKTYISNLVHTTHYWNDLRQVRSNPKYWRIDFCFLVKKWWCLQENQTPKNRFDLGLWCLTPLFSTFQLWRGSHFYSLRKPEYSKITNHIPVSSHWQTLSRNVVSSSPNRLLLTMHEAKLTLAYCF